MLSTRGPEPEQAAQRDAGFTLIEVMVASAVFGIVLVTFGVGMIQMVGAIGRTESLQMAQAQLHTAFQRLDHQVRYASAIGEPAAAADAAGEWYAEFLTDFTGTAVCTQLRIGTSLQQRSWTAGKQPGSAWSTLAAGVAAVGKPFTLSSDQEDGAGHQRLGVRISATAEHDGATRETVVTFTAMNSSVDTVAPTRCTEQRPHA
jgi:prepilin-type N-terminal cleavage/methylation domain-containing protein